MEFEQALEVVTRAFYQKIDRTLTQAEVALLFGAWNNLIYDRIAERSGYTTNYLQRDVAPKFWKLLSQVLDRKVNKTTLRAVLTYLDAPIPHPSHSQVQRLSNWGETINGSHFYGRVEEMEQLSRWLIQDCCRLIEIVGMGGIGKSALAAKVAQQVQDQFEFVIWRSLRNAPPLETLLAELVAFLSQQQDIQPKPERLLYWLQTHRCLVVLDNQDTLLQAGEQAGTYRTDFANYGELFHLLGEANHQSCMLLTSREKSGEIAFLEEEEGTVRSLSLKGSREVSLALINAKRLVGTDAEKHQLCEWYQCNPLALRMVATSIQSLFEGEIAAFLQTETPVFNGIRRLLDQQFQRLSSLEQTIMVWLAMNHEWMTIAELQNGIVPTVSRASLLEALKSLTWRSLIEKRVTKSEAKPTSEYTQHPMIREYVTVCFIQRIICGFLVVKLYYSNKYILIKSIILGCIQRI